MDHRQAQDTKWSSGIWYYQAFSETTRDKNNLEKINEAEASWDYIVPNLLKIYKETIRLQTLGKLKETIRFKHLENLATWVTLQPCPQELMLKFSHPKTSTLLNSPTRPWLKHWFQPLQIYYQTSWGHFKQGNIPWVTL